MPPFHRGNSVLGGWLLTINYYDKIEYESSALTHKEFHSYKNPQLLSNEPFTKINIQMCERLVNRPK